MRNPPPSFHRPSFASLAAGETQSSLSASISIDQMDALNLEQIAVNTLIASPFNRMRPYGEAELKDLADSIAMHGLLHPIIVRTSQKPGEYEIIAGHNRVEAAKLVGKPMLVARVFRNLDDHDAIIMANVTNLEQRQHIFPMDRARSYADLLDALRKKGTRIDYVAEVDAAERKSESRVGNNLYDEMAMVTGDGRARIARYIRLTYLVPHLQSYVDSEVLSLHAGAEISYLPIDMQNEIAQYMSEGKTITIEKAQGIRREAIQADRLLDYLSDERPKQVSQPSPKVKVPQTASLLKRLRKEKIITLQQQRQLDKAIERVVQDAADAYVREFLTREGKLNEEIERLLDER